EGRIYIRAEHLGTETVAAQITDLLHRTTDFKSGVQSTGEEVADKSALTLLGLGILALPVGGINSAFAILLAPMVDTLRIAAPLSLLNFLQIASRQGILIKDGRALELLAQVDTIVFDKTGTLTEEQPHVGAIYSCGHLDEDTLLRLAAAAEQKQTHPIAKAILKESQNRGQSLPKVENAKYKIGSGLEVTVGGSMVLIGSGRFIEAAGISIPHEMRLQQAYCNTEGASLVYIAVDNALAGVIELHPTVRPEARDVIDSLKKRGLSVYIISGDHEMPTKRIAESIGIEYYFAETLPEQKADLISSLQQEGRKVCFVGDGINDSIAMKTANVSVSLRGASMIAMDTAEVLLMDENLSQLIDLLDVAEKLHNNMRTNLFLTIVPGVTCVTGIFLFHFGVLSSLVLYNFGLVAGVGNAMWPLIGEQQNRTHS
ncbi:MAG: HAD family hydrolase, partial [Candidatus Electrothrix sp. AR3]|nr:HAD family hydrolase [Candidatus Electrothrix sp. AR3]